MTNVKPGDLARVIADPHNQGVLGLQVFVLGLPDSSWGRLPRIITSFYNTTVWEVEMLEARRITSFKGAHLKLAGCHVLAGDCFLRRIEPPADSLDLMRDEPIEADPLVTKPLYSPATTKEQA